MKQPKVLVLIVIALLSLVLVSCSGATQPIGGWSGSTVQDGMIYVGSRDGKVVAVNASTREQQWQWPDTSGLRSLIYTTPIVHGDLVYVGTYSGQVCAITSDRGVERWVYPRTDSIGAIVGRPVVVNETIYVTSSGGRVYALDTTYGDLKWKSDPLGDRVKLWTSPAVVGDTLYVSTFDDHIYALSAETGQLLNWSFQSEAGFTSSPVVYEGALFLGSFDRYLYAIEMGSNVSRWKFPQEKPAGNWFWASPVVSEGTVYAACLDGKLYAINATTGEEIWSYVTKDQKDKPSPIVSPPVLMDNLLIVVNESGTLYAFDLSADVGDEAVPLRAISIGASVRSSFCARDGLAYIRGEDNSIYVVDIEGGEIVEGWPVSLAAKE